MSLAPRPLLLAVATLVVAGLWAEPADSGVVFRNFHYAGFDRGSAPLGQDLVRNPILPGFHPDPSLCRVGRDFYLVNSTFTYFPGIPVYHSTDLSHWEPIGHVISRPTQVNFKGLGISRGVFAPDLTFHDGLYYLVTTLVDCGGNCVFTAKDPAGPWSDPVPLRFDGIDPSLFWDDDGHAWLVNNGPPPGPPQYSGHRAIWIRSFDAGKRAVGGAPRVLIDGGTDITKKPVWIEGPHLFKRLGRYFLICAEGGTAENHSEVAFRAATLDGPWERDPANPILTQRDLDPARLNPITSTGHAEFVQLADGRTWSVFLGCRPYALDRYNTGRETFASPVAWENGWPMILPHGRPVPAMIPAELPSTPLLPETSPDLFPSDLARSEWCVVRTPETVWWHPDRSGQSVTIEPRTDSLSGNGNPSFLARRLADQAFIAETELDVRSLGTAAAGLVAFQNETHYFYLRVQRSGPGVSLQVRQSTGGEETAVGAAQQVPWISGPLKLRLSAHGASYTFSYSIGETRAEIGPELDGGQLSTAVAGGFVGAFVGVYATIAPIH